ncbi:hypothetical protein GCM10011331_25410 [Flavimobilis marinus]|uniref:SpoIID/LytB domain protein n=1 Tax=Flavimobilis marinus TaxID=285351 RepID=A0A1I2HIU6_9MICO|nr:SpoIID/LytB domain-containing protein [Flavimobilis marinus]GHG57403.1 hypothetical protein GCM10011331_25410 [Flavimobilis marinus]SFF29210.1 SpoIID/LytB domain protein [Flavimobilis marinus]
MRHRRLLSLFTVLTLVLGGLVAAPASAAPTGSTATAVLAAQPTASPAASGLVAAKRGTDLRLGGTSTVLKGYWGTLTGKWFQNGKRMTGAVRFEKLVRGTWKTIRRERVVNGVVKIRVKPSSATKYRIARGSATATKTVKVDNYYVKLSSTERSVVKGRWATPISVKYMKLGKLPSKGALRLQKLRGKTWKTAKTVRIVDGRAKVSLKPSSTTQYRLVTTNGKVASKTITVRVTADPNAIPASFTVTGSGYGHGVGMSQFGAFQMAREGKSAAQILQHYYSGTSVVERATPSTVAVQVFGPEPYKFGGYADTASATRFSASDAWTLRDADGKALRTGTAKDTVQLKQTGSKVQATVRRDGKDEDPIVRGTGFRLTFQGSTASLSSRMGASYRYGELVATNIGGKLNVVEELSLTHYLYGLAEMPSSWGSNGGAAALQAQAITGRSYAIDRIGADRKAACNCDLVDDVRDQNYTGWVKAGEGTNEQYGKIWRAAVDATESSSARGQLLVGADGKPVTTYYYSSSGGRTANSEDVWASAQTHLKSVDDGYSLRAPGNTMRTWTRGLSQARAKEIFGLDSVVSIAVTATYSSGQMKTLTATSGTGVKASVTAKADVLRSRLGLPAAWVASVTAVR